MKREIIGGLLVVGGIVSLPLTLVLYAIVIFVISSGLSSGADVPQSIVILSNLVRMFLGLVPLVGIFIGIPVGAYLLFTEDKKAKK